MSTKYQSSKDVPTDALISRLRELSDAVTGGRDSHEREFTMRIPAECDRDADIVIAEAATRLTHLQSEVERLRGRLCKTCEGTGMIGGPSPSAPDEGGEPCPECNAWLLRKQAEAIEPAIRTALRNLGNADLREEDIAQFAYDYAQRLRQQAAEIES